MLYVVFQSSLRIEYFDVIKHRFNQEERVLAKNFKARHLGYIFFFSLMIAALFVDIYVLEFTEGI